MNLLAISEGLTSTKGNAFSDAVLFRISLHRISEDRSTQSISPFQVG